MIGFIIGLFIGSFVGCKYSQYIREKDSGSLLKNINDFVRIFFLKD